MKKLFLTIITLIFFAPLWSQNATLKDLQGKWKLVTYATLNASLDVASRKATVTESGKSLGELNKQLLLDMEGYAENLQIAYVEIEGNNFMSVIYDVVKAGPFTISDEKDYQVISAKFDDGTSANIYLIIKDDKLILHYPASSKTYTYAKQ
ncbi:hypothetical protein R1T16_10165 [Flavobacterium sp. DG1-102-2]|uniref:hypothetical protein n=1 Tax=Flavobacterium sp. DG1-102-2 TaxID=3081663 RepID=UPI002949EE7A|nr:hypothetical protein [Flavobacterium sp. DG1-102-2]MDV6168791.1 hypothetical protein [Flavobacterium sp. DG1-102-2]